MVINVIVVGVTLLMGGFVGVWLAVLGAAPGSRPRSGSPWPGTNRRHLLILCLLGEKARDESGSRTRRLGDRRLRP